ncbi:hypothetical protein BJX76DRAFT_367631 [Aspergillus varians]
MPSNIFDDLQSPVSYDADFDRGWRLVSEKKNDAVAYLYQLLQRVYWEAVEDEIANAILAFDDYKTFVPGGLPDLEDGALESEYLRELLDLWDPIGLPEEIKNNVCGSVFDEVRERQKIHQDELIARAFLQACGLTDYDYVQEYRRPTFPSLGPAPQGMHLNSMTTPCGQSLPRDLPGYPMFRVPLLYTLVSLLRMQKEMQ